MVKHSLYVKTHYIDSQLQVNLCNSERIYMIIEKRPPISKWTISTGIETEFVDIDSFPGIDRIYSDWMEKIKKVGVIPERMNQPRNLRASRMFGEQINREVNFNMYYKNQMRVYFKVLVIRGRIKWKQFNYT